MTLPMLAKENPEWQQKFQAAQENRRLDRAATHYRPEIFLP